MSNEWDVETQYDTNEKIRQELKGKYDTMDITLKDMDEQFQELENVPVPVLSAWNKAHDDANKALLTLRNLMARNPMVPD